MRTKRIALIGASLVLMGGMTAACGGSPSDASEKDFCAAYDKIDQADDVKALKKAVDNFEDVGTPKGMPDDARDGYELAIDLLDDIKDEDDTLDEDEVSKKDKKKLEAFTKYSEKTCS